MVNISSLLSSIKIIEEISYLAYLSIESFEVKNSPVYHKISICKFADSSQSLRTLPDFTCNVRELGFVFAVFQEYTEVLRSSCCRPANDKWFAYTSANSFQRLG